MYAKSCRKKFLIPVAVVLTAALGIGIWFITRSGGEPVNVYPFSYIGMTEFWGDAQESYGPVATDKIQTEFLSDTQTVTEVKVKDGDLVKKGDVLFSFDTTLDALTLERKRLDVEKIKVQIKAAEERLAETKKLTPYTPPEPEEPEEADLGEELKDQLYKISENTVYDGKTKETALICWLKDGTSVSDALLQKLYETAQNYQLKNAEKAESEEKEEISSNASNEPEDEKDPDAVSDEPESLVIPKIKVFSSCNDKDMQEDTLEETQFTENDREIYKYIIPDVRKNSEGKTCWLVSATRNSDRKLLTDLEIEGYPREDAEDQQQWEQLWSKDITLEYVREVAFAGKLVQGDQLVSFDPEKPVELKIGQDAVLVISSEICDLEKEATLQYFVSPDNGIFQTTQEGNLLFLMGKPEKLTDASGEAYTVTARYEFDDSEGDSWRVDEEFIFRVSVVSQVKAGEFYVVFKTTEKNFLKGTPVVWQGVKVTVYEEGGFDMSLFDASAFADHTLPPPEDIEIELPEIDPEAIYTAEQILEMQKQLYATIKEQKEKLKLTESEYAIMQRELGDGNVYADIDGKVVSMLTEEEAREQNQPFLKVSGGGGFYIEGSVSELEKESLKLGQEVTVNDWNTGNVYTGEVVSIGDFPTDSDNWNGMGNPTASYYPFKAFVGEDADLTAGSYVSMSYSTASAEQGIYLEKAFVRTEKGNSYIFVRGADGRLEKRDVKVGKVLWGSYYEILSPLGEEDCLAFPYGKNVKHGAPTVESDLSVLYGY